MLTAAEVRIHCPKVTDGEKGVGRFAVEGLGHHCCLPWKQSDHSLSLSVLQFVTPSARCSTSKESSFLSLALPSPPHSQRPWRCH